MTKEEARKQMRRMRRDMTPQERSRQNESIRRQILADPVWKEVSWFYPFVSYYRQNELAMSYTVARQHIRLAEFTLSNYLD